MEGYRISGSDGLKFVSYNCDRATSIKKCQIYTALTPINRSDARSKNPLPESGYAEHSFVVPATSLNPMQIALQRNFCETK